MRFEGLDRFCLGVHDNGFIMHTEHAVGQQRQTNDVIHMGMGQKYMTYTGHMIERQIAQTGTCVY